MTDSQTLLAEYARSGSESAFRELVTRYVGLVYSTAVRLVDGDIHLAEDVSQTVFLDLARKARSLSSGVMLGGWLHQRTFNVAAPLMRAARRRQSREREAVQMSAMQDQSAADFEQIAPILDEALTKLGTEDRTAVILRFFERRDFRSIGMALGTDEDAARMRLTRALKKLHILLKHQGVTLSATALGAALSAEVATAAPLGLAASVAGAALAGSTVGGGVIATLLKIGLMTKLKTGIVGAIVIASAVMPLVIEHQNVLLLREKDALLRERAEQLARFALERQRFSNLLALVARDRALSDTQFKELMRLRGEVGRLRNDVSEKLARQTKPTAPGIGVDGLAEKERQWSARVSQLKAWSEANASEKIPELQFLNARDWVESIFPRTLETEEDYARAMSTVRGNAELKVMQRLGVALRQYGRDNNGQIPADVSQLGSYLDPPVDDAILQRYKILPANNLVPELQGHGDLVITQKAPVNGELDLRFAQGLTSGGMADMRVTNRWALVP